MDNVIIVYASIHHGNTKKVIDAVKERCGVVCMTAAEAEKADLSSYDLIGFASGVYCAKLHKSLYGFIEKSEKIPSKAFILYTCGGGGTKYAADFSEKLKNRSIDVLGTFSCKGFNTYGPFKIIGGISKKHPSAEDIDNAVSFVERIKR